MVAQASNKAYNAMINLIIPMAGKGKRMRPHTLTTPKPLIPIAGKPIVARLVEEVGVVCQGQVGTIGFVVQELAPDTQAQLRTIAQGIGAQAQFYEQQAALGTAHAIFCAQELIKGHVIIAFADTLFKGSAALDTSQESIIWVKKVPDPSAFGVVKLGDDQLVTDFVEKPASFIADLAIIGLYYFREGRILQEVIQQLIEQGAPQDGEYQLTAALAAMKHQGVRFATQEVAEWLDCGNKEATIHTNQRFLTLLRDDKDLIAPTARVHNSVIIPPVYLGEGIVVKNAILGPYVSVGSYTHIDDSRIQNSIIQEHSMISNANLKDSMLGNYVHLMGKIAEVNVGDYNTLIG